MYAVCESHVFVVQIRGLIWTIFDSYIHVYVYITPPIRFPKCQKQTNSPKQKVKYMMMSISQPAQQLCPPPSLVQSPIHIYTPPPHPPSLSHPKTEILNLRSGRCNRNPTPITPGTPPPTVLIRRRTPTVPRRPATLPRRHLHPRLVILLILQVLDFPEGRLVFQIGCAAGDIALSDPRVELIALQELGGCGSVETGHYFIPR